MASLNHNIIFDNRSFLFPAIRKTKMITMLPSGNLYLLYLFYLFPIEQRGR